MSRKKKSIFVDFFIFMIYLYFMAQRKMYNTTLDENLLRKLKVLAAQIDKRQNDLLEEGIRDLLKKYEKEPSKPR